MRSFCICDASKADKTAPVCKREGYGIELHTFYRPERCRDKELIAQHRETIKGISEVAIHGPFWDLDMGNADEGIRDTAREMFDLGYSAAKQVGATGVVFHLGYVPENSPYDKWLERFVTTWSKFCRGKSKDIRFFLENTAESTPNFLFDALDSIDDSRTFGCLDIGHAHYMSRIPVTQWVETLGSRIGHVHFHDNDGSADQHLPVGEGTIPMKEVCDALEKHAPDAIWAIECDWEPALDWFREHRYL